MSRKLRLEYPGAMYHVMSRGDQRQDIFRDDDDREKFLSALGEACVKTEWQVQAYCLMRNHFHLVLETPPAQLGFRDEVAPGRLPLNPPLTPVGKDDFRGGGEGQTGCGNLGLRDLSLTTCGRIVPILSGGVCP